MMLNTLLKKRVKELERMSLREAESFRDDVIASLLDNPTRFYLYDLISKRIKNLSQDEAMITNEDPFISGFEVEV